MAEIKVPHKHYYMAENLYDELGLDVYEHRLIMHYLRRGNCFERIDTTAKVCRMSRKRAQSARDTLEEKGLIRTIRKEGFKTTITIEVIDIQTDNVLYYSSGTVQNPALAQLIETAKNPRKSTIGRFVTDANVTDANRPTKNTNNKNTTLKNIKTLVAGATCESVSNSKAEVIPSTIDYGQHLNNTEKEYLLAYEELLGNSPRYLKGEINALKRIVSSNVTLEDFRLYFGYVKEQPFYDDKRIKLSAIELNILDALPSDSFRQYKRDIRLDKYDTPLEDND